MFTGPVEAYEVERPKRHLLAAISAENSLKILLDLFKAFLTILKSPLHYQTILNFQCLPCNIIKFTFT